MVKNKKKEIYLDDYLKEEVKNFKDIVSESKKLKDKRVIIVVGDKGSGKTTLVKQAFKRAISFDRIIEKDVESFFIKSKEVSNPLRLFFWFKKLFSNGVTWSIIAAIIAAIIPMPWVAKLTSNQANYYLYFSFLIILTPFLLWFLTYIVYSFSKKILILENSNNIQYKIQSEQKDYKNSKDHIEWKKDLDYKIKWLQTYRKRFQIIIEMSHEDIKNYEDAYKYNFIIFNKYKIQKEQIKKIWKKKIETIAKVPIKKPEGDAFRELYIKAYKDYINDLEKKIDEHSERFAWMTVNILDSNLHQTELIMSEYNIYKESEIYLMIDQFFTFYLKKIGIDINDENVSKNKWTSADLKVKLITDNKYKILETKDIGKDLSLINVRQYNNKINKIYNWLIENEKISIMSIVNEFIKEKWIELEDIWKETFEETGYILRDIGVIINRVSNVSNSLKVMKIFYDFYKEWIETNKKIAEFLYQEKKEGIEQEQLKYEEKLLEVLILTNYEEIKNDINNYKEVLNELVGELLLITWYTEKISENIVRIVEYIFKIVKKVDTIFSRGTLKTVKISFYNSKEALEEENKNIEENKIKKIEINQERTIFLVMLEEESNGYKNYLEVSMAKGFFKV